MNTNILKTITTALAVMMCWSAAAQNLDPTVEVNRAYEGKLLEIYKPALNMAVPDTVRQFDLDFDYSVFDNPYRGSYEFKPYELMMKPFAVERNAPSFWLKAGAGYTFHPDLELVWTPVRKGNFAMSVYANYDAYFGGYRTFKPEDLTGDELKLNRWSSDNGSTSLWKGYRMQSDLGIQGQYDWKKGAASFDIGYFGIASKDTLKSRSMNGFDLNFNVSSKPSGDVYFHYDIDVDYSMAIDKLAFETRNSGLVEHDFDFEAEVGAVIAKSHHLLFDLGLQTVAYSGDLGVSATEMFLTPHYLMNKGRWGIDLGIKIAKIMVPEKSEHYDVKDQVIYPDVSVKFSAIKNALNIYANVGGGNVLNTYKGLMYRNPFVDMDFGRGRSMLDASVERISARLGLDGRISKRFMYDLHVGYSNMNNGLLDAVALDAERYMPAVGYASYQKLYAGLDWNLYAESFTFKGGVEYARYNSDTQNDGNVFLLMPASLTGNVVAEYNWNRRVIVGVDCNFSSARKGAIANRSMVVPGFADLGAYVEYAASNKLSFWLRGGNLMNMTVQYCPLYAEKGISFTGGICLKL